jgi:hypothetical protein
MLKDLLIGGLLFGTGLLVGLWWGWPTVEEPDRSPFWFPARQSPQAQPCSIIFGSLSAEAETLDTETDDWLCPNLSPVAKAYDMLRCVADTANASVDVKVGDTWMSGYHCGEQLLLMQQLTSAIVVEPGMGLTVQVHGYGVARYVHLTLVPSETGQEDQ